MRFTVRLQLQLVNSLLSGFAEAVETGFDTWSTLEQLTYVRKDLSVTNSGQAFGNADGINNVVWYPTSEMWEDSIDAPTNVVAVTRVRYNALNGEMIDVDLAFNGEPISLAGLGQFYWATDGSSDKLDVQNVTTHEAGHYGGLRDLYNPGDFAYLLEMKNNNQLATMYGRIDVGETYKNSLHPGPSDPDWFSNQLDITRYDVGGINYIYNNLGDIYYDIVLVFDGTTNFTSTEVLNGFIPSKNAALELITKMRIGDRVGWVNGSSTEPLGDDFNAKLNTLNLIEPNSTGNLADRILCSSIIIELGFRHKQKSYDLLFSAGEVSPFSLITELGVDPEIKIYTMGFEDFTAGQDLMSWLAQ